MDHYTRLGVKRTASRDEIKRAYRKLAVKVHPDKSSAPDASEKFRSLNEAYEILCDDKKRETYDKFDLPFAGSSSPSSSKRHRNEDRHSDSRPRERRSDDFFTGSSDKARSERRYQDELERIRDINTRLLEKVNVKREIARRRATGKSKSKSMSSTQFIGDILPEMDHEDYEKLVIGKLRAMISD